MQEKEISLAKSIQKYLNNIGWKGIVASLGIIFVASMIGGYNYASHTEQKALPITTRNQDSEIFVPQKGETIGYSPPVQQTINYMRYLPELFFLLLLIVGAYWLGQRSKEKTLKDDMKQNNGSIINTIASTLNFSLNKKTNSTKSKGIEVDQYELSNEQQALFEKLENTHANIFVTGKAGTGKSLLLQYFRTHTQKKLIVVAPTGVAALNIGGQTIHSLFHLPWSVITNNKRETLRLDQKATYVLKNLDTVVIDEISMVRVDQLEAIDYLLKKSRDSQLPFGGAQIIVFGDFYQLPPIVDSKELQKYFSYTYGGAYCFNSSSWKTANFVMSELSNIFRQKDSQFITILNSIREGCPDNVLLLELNKRAHITIPVEGTIMLATTNHLVTEINERKLHELPGQIYEFKAEITGQLEKSAFPTDEILRLKVGAQIMMLRNDRDKRWVNGTLGTISSITFGVIKVDIDGFQYAVSRETWNKISYYYNREDQKVEEEIVSTFCQFPLRLAWAITIHKSQGQTYRSVVIHLGNGAFTHGQTYVALSRCTALDTLYLKHEIAKQDIIVDPEITSFMRSQDI